MTSDERVGHWSTDEWPALDQGGTIEWIVAADPGTDACEPRFETSLEYNPDDAEFVVTGRLRVLRDLHLVAGIRIVCRQAFGVALYERGVAQHIADRDGWIASASPLRIAYGMSAEIGSTTVEPVGDHQALCAWNAEDETFSITVLAAGEVHVERESWVAGSPDLASIVVSSPFRGGSEIVLRIRVRVSPCAAPLIEPHATMIPDPENASAHAVALWGSQVPAVGSLEFPGSAYPTVNLPRRAYGSLHTFFDPDAWSVVASLSFSGIPYLQDQARQILERALSHVRADGLAPHHFDGDEPTYLAISGAAQPGPNLFIIEAAVDHACATGDYGWLRGAWTRGLRRVTDWILDRFDPDRGLLNVNGSLWIDVFRRAGYTLDSNAMAVRTLMRAADVAELCGEHSSEARLRATAAAIRENLIHLWPPSADHFITARSDDWAEIDDHVDAENYLAIATGAADKHQARAIMALFDASPLTHPGDRGTWVSLRPYTADDCHLGNTGDSDTALARLWWADMMSRRATGDATAFWRHFNPVRADLLRSIWMRERYDSLGHQTRARGYHEYPGLTDMLIREAVYGLTLNVSSVEIAPMRDGPFSVRFGQIALEYGLDRVALNLHPSGARSFVVRGLRACTEYVHAAGRVHTDLAGTARFSLAAEHASQMSLRAVGLEKGDSAI